MMKSVPFMEVSDEPRIIEIVKEMVDAKEVDEYDTFFKEPKAKRNRRHKKYAKENVEAAEIAKKLKKEDGDLTKQIQNRQEERKSFFLSFVDRLESKYGGVDNSDEVDFELPAKRRKKQETKVSNKTTKTRSTRSSK